MNRKISEKTIHGQVKQGLLEEIRKMKIGTRLPPERGLAEQFEVSRMTINKVMKELTDEGYLSRRVGDGTYVMPRPQPVARITESGTSRGEIIIVYPDFYSFPIWQRVHLTEVMAMRANYRLVSVKNHPEVNWSPFYELVDECRHLRGIVIVASVPLDSELRKLDTIGCPVVVIGELSDPGAYEHLFAISIDHFQSGFLKMDTLLQAGHRNLGWIPNEPPSLAGQQTLRGMKTALYRHKLRYHDLVKPSTRIDFWQSPMEAGYRQTLEVMKEHPELTALVVDTFPGAIGTLRALHEMGISCPEQVSVITAYEDAGLEEYTCPKLSTVVEPFEVTIGTAMRIIENGGTVESRSIAVDVKLKERESIKKL